MAGEAVVEKQFESGGTGAVDGERDTEQHVKGSELEMGHEPSELASIERVEKMYRYVLLSHDQTHLWMTQPIINDAG